MPDVCTNCEGETFACTGCGAHVDPHGPNPYDAKLDAVRALADKWERTTVPARPAFLVAADELRAVLDGAERDDASTIAGAMCVDAHRPTWGTMACSSCRAATARLIASGVLDGAA